MNKKILILISLILISLGFIGCSTQPDNLNFVPDTSLNVAINATPSQSTLRGQMGADAPRVVSFQLGKIAILHEKGINIYDIETGNVDTIIDIQKLGFSGTQGDQAIIVHENKPYLILSSPFNQTGYIYDVKSESLQKMDNMSTIAENELTDIHQAEMENLAKKAKIDNMDGYNELVGVKNEDQIALVKMDYNELSNSMVYIMDSQGKILNQFYL